MQLDERRFVAHHLHEQVRPTGGARRGAAIGAVEHDEARLHAHAVADLGHDGRVLERTALAQSPDQRFGPLQVMILVREHRLGGDEAQVGQAEVGLAHGGRHCSASAALPRSARGDSLRDMANATHRMIGLAVFLAACRAHAAPATRMPRAGEQFVGAIRAGFSETVVADSLDSPVSMALAPDGRVFVCEQPGRLRVVRAGHLLPRPFVTVPTRAVEEEGLLGVAFDPAFAHTHRVYVLYTALEPTRHNVIAYYRAAGDTAADEGTIVFEFDTHAVHQHVGGALRFGRDGMLYASSGECGEGSLSQSLASTAGKMLRMRPDGSIPADNPFPTSTRGRHAAIWARGFRNAFAFDIQPAHRARVRE